VTRASGLEEASVMDGSEVNDSGVGVSAMEVSGISGVSRMEGSGAGVSNTVVGSGGADSSGNAFSKVVVRGRHSSMVKVDVLHATF